MGISGAACGKAGTGLGDDGICWWMGIDCVGIGPIHRQQYTVDGRDGYGQCDGWHVVDGAAKHRTLDGVDGVECGGDSIECVQRIHVVCVDVCVVVGIGGVGMVRLETKNQGAWSQLAL